MSGYDELRFCTRCSESTNHSVNGFTGITRCTRCEKTTPPPKTPCTDPDKMLGAADQKFDPKEHELCIGCGVRVAPSPHYSKIGQGPFCLTCISNPDAIPPDPARDAEVLRRAAEILSRNPPLEDGQLADGRYYIKTGVANKLTKLASDLEAPPKPKTFTTTWTNADPRPFNECRYVIQVDHGGIVNAGTLIPHACSDGTLANWQGESDYLITDDEPWPADLYWTRLPDVEEPDDG